MDICTENCDHKHIPVGFSFKHTPPKKWTHVDDAITRICSDMAARAYTYADMKGEAPFTFSSNNQEVETVLFDDQGYLEPALPPFAAAVTGTTMILAWRGSGPLANWISDANIPPVTSSKWGKVSKSVRVHAGFHAFAENDLNLHEDELLKAMEAKGVTELVVTGHSLGGGIAQTAQVAILGQLQQEGNKWYDYKTKLELAGKRFVVKNVGFSAPMSIMNSDTQNDPKTKAFLDQIASNSCNIIYDMDVVPHVPGNLDFVEDMFQSLISEIGKSDEIPFPLKLVGVEKRLQGTFDKATTSETFIKLRSILDKFHHYGTVIHYENDGAQPKAYKSYTGNETGDDDFKNIKFRSSNHIVENAKVDHNCTVRGPGLSCSHSVSEGKLASKLHWLNDHAILKGKHDVENVRVNGWEDCLIKAKEHLVSPCMGAVVAWDKEPSNKPMQEREGTLYIKSDLPKLSKDAKVEHGGLFSRKPQCTTFWRNGGLKDLKESGDYIKGKGKDYGYDD